MLTFQILDVGETYLRPLENGSVTVGSGDAVNIHLAEDGVASLHATIEVDGDRCQIRADGGQSLVVNGQTTESASLVLGDRVELGKAVLVLGQQRQRPATAGDVLAPTSMRTGRREPFSDKRSASMKRMLVFVLLLGAAGAFGLWKWGKGVQETHLPYADREAVVHARKTGRFDDALARLASAQDSWAGEIPIRVSQINVHRALVEDTQQAFEGLRVEFMARVFDETERQQVNKLKTIRSNGNRAEREASVILMSGIRDYRMAAESVAIAKGGVVVPKPKVEEVPSIRRIKNLPKPEWLDARVVEIGQFHKARNYVHAIELAKVTLPEVPAQHAGPLLEIMAEVRRAARTEMHALVSKAYAMRKKGKLSEAVRMLQGEAMRFPGQGNLSYLYRELDQLSAELGVPGPTTPKVDMSSRKPPAAVVSKTDTPAPTRGDAVGSPTAEDRPTGRLDKRLIATVLREVEKAEKAGDLQTALTLLRESVEQNSAYQPGLSRYLTEIRADLELIQTLTNAAAAAGAQIGNKTIKLRNGERCQIVRLEGSKIHAKVGTESREIAWLDLPLRIAEQLAEAANLDPKTCLGIAALGYRQGDTKAAEASLVRVLGRDAGLFGAASKVISRGRGEFVDELGYTLVSGKFVAVRFIKVQKLAKKLASKLSRYGRLTAAERDKALEEIREAGEDGTDDALVLALKDQLETLADQVGRSSLPKALAKLSARRDQLDAARKHAKDLIYDSKTYFYPYKPPAVPGARYGEYLKVQKEVDIRVDALREIWEHKTRIPVGANLRKEIEFLLWTENQLGLMGEVSDRVLQHMDWIHTIPPVDVLTLHSFCRTPAEKDDFEHYAKIDRHNEQLADKLNVGEMTLVRVTNAYRAMFGHRPLAISLKLHEAAHGHGEEMSRLGYFSHTSPTKERRTPFRRMKLVGYDYGVSENIAMGGSARGAHVRWCHSSGHHRNLLNARHTEVGMGNCSKYWVENFGRGKSYDK